MAYQSPIGNPFMLMLHPEVVLAAIENSERLGKLDRRLCRPLDRHVVGTPAAEEAKTVSDYGMESADDDR